MTSRRGEGLYILLIGQGQVYSPDSAILEAPEDVSSQEIELPHGEYALPVCNVGFRKEE
ncbi:MAG: hypothetical protein KAW09_06745 [Thermoplasmata archaeon]|nr:hypothetical protein [Thermoplasmata archaeon]